MSIERVVIIGGGQAARRTCEELRELGFAGDITLVGEEAELPYDRPMLSKDVLKDFGSLSKVFVKGRDWYVANRIDLRLGVRAEKIDRAGQCVYLDNREILPYDRLLIATGSRPRPFPGNISADNLVHYVRTIEDVRRLNSAMLSAKNIAILGGGFIGLEIAASLTALGIRVRVLDPAQQLLQRSVPLMISETLKSAHESRGVMFNLGETSTSIELHESGQVLLSGATSDYLADLVIVGIGVHPNTELAEEAGLKVNNGIVVDQYCRTDDPLIYAAGEVTNHYNSFSDCRLRVESWKVAEDQPAIAARNMLGASEAYEDIPWLWSDQYDINLQTLGRFDPGMILVKKELDKVGSYCVFGLDQSHRLAAVAGINAGREVSIARKIMQRRIPLDLQDLGDAAMPLRKLLI
ncbi:hypothetical protein SB11R_04790 [Pseudomonas oryzihabitans]|nr:hypothetical protein SB11R_04790 [Pseudomonas psychrotolerans]